MNQKIKLSFVAMLMIICNFSARSYDFEHNGFYYNIKSLSDLTVSLTYNENNVYSGDVVIPSTAEFSGKTFSVVDIEEGAFLGCYIGQLTIPSSVLTGTIVSNGYYDYDDNRRKRGYIESIIIEDSDVCLESLKIESGKSLYIGRNESANRSYSICCNYNSSLESVSFGIGVTSVCERCFECCENLESVDMPGIEIINGFAFWNCYNLKSVNALKVEYICDAAFEYCSSLESLSFPSLKYVYGSQHRFGAFQGCISLKNMVLPPGLVCLGDAAFMDCTNLESIVIPASIMKMDDRYGQSYAFSGCTKLTSISMNRKSPLAIPEDAFDPMTYVSATLYVPAGCAEAYKSADVWKNFFNIEEDASLCDDVICVSLDKSNLWGGDFDILDKKQTYIIGDEITIVFQPDPDYPNYAVSEVWVNGENLISYVENNRLTITLEDNTTISAKFSYHYEPVDPDPEPEPSINGDMNGDGKITIADVVILVNMILEGDN